MAWAIMNGRHNRDCKEMGLHVRATRTAEIAPTLREQMAGIQDALKKSSMIRLSGIRICDGKRITMNTSGKDEIRF